MRRRATHINAVASAIARRLSAGQRRQTAHSAIASAVARRLQRGGRRSLANSVASALTRRLGLAKSRRFSDALASAVARRIKGGPAIAPGAKRTRIDMLASAVARKLAQPGGEGGKPAAAGADLPTHSESMAKNTGGEKAGDVTKRPRP